MQSKLRKVGPEQADGHGQPVVSRCRCYLNMEPMGSIQIMDGHTGRTFPTCQGLSCSQLLHCVRHPAGPSLEPRLLCARSWNG